MARKDTIVTTQKKISAAGKLVNQPEAGIVPGQFVIGARIAEADDQPDGGAGHGVRGMKEARRNWWRPVRRSPGAGFRLP